MVSKQQLFCRKLILPDLLLVVKKVPSIIDNNSEYTKNNFRLQKSKP